MQSARVRATEAKRLLHRRMKQAIRAGSADQGRLTNDYLAAIALEVETLKKEIAKVLNPTDLQAPQLLIDAVAALTSEVERQKNDDNRWVELGDAIRIARSAVDLFEIA